MQACPESSEKGPCFNVHQDTVLVEFWAGGILSRGWIIIEARGGGLTPLSGSGNLATVLLP